MEIPEPDGRNIKISPAIHGAIKALGQDPRHAVAVGYIVDVLCGRHRCSFVAGVENAATTMAWFEGRRFIAEMIMRMVERPVEPEAAPAEPRMYELPMTERKARRERAKPTRG